MKSAAYIIALVWLIVIIYCVIEAYFSEIQNDDDEYYS
jgi:hypothetical protein